MRGATTPKLGDRTSYNRASGIKQAANGSAPRRALNWHHGELGRGSDAQAKALCRCVGGPATLGATSAKEALGLRRYRVLLTQWLLYKLGSIRGWWTHKEGYRRMRNQAIALELPRGSRGKLNMTESQASH